MPIRQERAAQNREELLSAAIQIFRTHGINAPLQLIIDEAQVGRATFYRNFADRRELVLALMEQALDRLENRARSHMKHSDGFIRLIHDHIHNIPYLTALMEYWRVIERNDPAMVQIYQRRNAILQPLIDNAIIHGICRADFSPNDYAMVTSILRAALQGHTHTEQEALAARAVELLLNGIRA
ncbi:TetR/AcrR family transcriptional regulator [Acinetobacter tianfuensis]|uniref:TetR/AcrR family transcriptional regulator n=1 Tax=Acinetobacter tianfuensis TaxID=2419603 RepID=A0A3A8ELQ7_9GAMM|nr:TetR/AcrR family transcriptional regulator [Acinetobacter tianfuensis]RKG29791.1 TetR/AcrR family transcriptional regulator [Acinetobacter tianfuensis]